MLRSGAAVASEAMRARGKAATLLVLGLLAVMAAFSVLFVVGIGPAQAATTFTVNSTGDAVDLTPAGDTCDTNDTAEGDQCTLRAAIQQANATSGPDTIDFDIPSTACDATSGVCRIELGSSSLHGLTEGVTIDGYTQTGGEPNTIADARQGTNAKIKVELDGSCAGCDVGFFVMADGVTIKGLAIYGFSNGNAIFSLGGTDDLTIQGNFIGTNSGGTEDRGNGGGVQIQSTPLGTANVTVGGVLPADRNLISGNNSDAVYLANARDSEVRGNLIGTQKDGTTPLPNEGTGVVFSGDSSSSNPTGNSVGGLAVGAVNVIAYHPSEGVNVCGTGGTYTQAEIRRNSIFSNFTGINLCLTFPSDPGDTDTGSNAGQNIPVITSAKTSRRATIIKGTLDSEPTQGYTLEFFSNPAASPDQGKTFKVEKSVVTDGAGHASFSLKLRRGKKISPGQFVTATATRTDRGDTSEFSAPRKVRRA